MKWRPGGVEKVWMDLVQVGVPIGTFLQIWRWPHGSQSEMESMDPTSPRHLHAPHGLLSPVPSRGGTGMDKNGGIFQCSDF